VDEELGQWAVLGVGDAAEDEVVWCCHDGGCGVMEY
jgi:hypothetical protein